MAVEPKRGCGYRKIGGLYMVSGGVMVPCDRLPFELNVCPCCGEGIKQARGWTWITPYDLLEGDHDSDAFFTDDDVPRDYSECRDDMDCPVCFPSNSFKREDEDGNWIFDGKAGLIWIGKAHYKTPRDFMEEGAALGISRRVNSIPNDFELGKTWIFLAHPEAVKSMTFDEEKWENGELEEAGPEYAPGIFTAFRPTKLERIVKQSEYDLWKKIEDERVEFNETEEWKDWMENRVPEHIKKVYKKLQRDKERGITFVPVPDSDPDHQ